MGKQLGFGLVTLPVKLVTATKAKDVAFNQITPDGNRTQAKSFDAVTGEEVTGAQLRKGYEWSKGNYVVLTPDEVKACAPIKDDLIEIEQFVDENEIDPLHFEKSWYLQPDPAAAKPYALLVETLGGMGKVGIAQAVMGNKEQLVAIRVVGKAMVLTTLFYSDELKDQQDLGLTDIAHTEEELKLAAQLVEAKAKPFDPKIYSDGYRDRLLALIAARAEDATAEAPQRVEQPVPAVQDLMAALKASVDAAAAPVATKPAKKAKVA